MEIKQQMTKKKGTKDGAGIYYKNKVDRDEVVRGRKGGKCFYKVYSKCMRGNAKRRDERMVSGFPHDAFTY